MNYLAHAFLSFNNEGILVGNMISDFVKGRKKLEYPPEIQQGIHLHRLIDSFTDFHPVTAKAKEFFRSHYRLYSGAFVDIVYDHFLALDSQQFTGYGGLEPFTKVTYQLLDRNVSSFPITFQKMFPYMKTQNWLYNYRLKDGIQKSFGGLVHRASYLYDSETAFDIFNNHYNELQNCYYSFFPELKEFTLKNLKDIGL